MREVQGEHISQEIYPNQNQNTNAEANSPQPQPDINQNQKFCKHCGQRINIDAVMCVFCGRQVEELKSAQSPNIVINNANDNRNSNINNNNNSGKQKNKWVAFLLCLFLGVFGFHRFYEGKIGTGIIYLFTAGLLGFGVLIDLIIILFRPNPYYV